MNRSAVLNLNARTLPALGAARQLGSEGIRVDGLFLGSDGRFGLGRVSESSRWWRRKDFLPGPDSDRDLVDALVGLASRYREPPVLMPTDDDSILAISRYRANLQDLYRFRLSAASVLNGVLNKHVLYPHAAALGLAVPSTTVPYSREAVRSISETIKYPCLLKPTIRSPEWRRLYGGQKVVTCSRPLELLRAYEQYRESLSGEECLVQEIIPGPEHNLVSGFVCLAADGSCLLRYQCRKLRQFPPLMGNAAAAEASPDPEIDRATLQVVRRLNMTGNVAVEFKRDPAGRLVMLDITLNRLDGLGVRADLSGVTIPLVWDRDLVGEPAAEIVMQSRTIGWVSEPEEIRALPRYLGRGAVGPFQILKNYLRLRGLVVFSWTDLRPSLSLLGWLLAKLGRAFSSRAG